MHAFVLLTELEKNESQDSSLVTFLTRVQLSIDSENVLLTLVTAYGKTSSVAMQIIIYRKQLNQFVARLWESFSFSALLYAW